MIAYAEWQLGHPDEALRVLDEAPDGQFTNGLVVNAALVAASMCCPLALPYLAKAMRLATDPAVRRGAVQRAIALLARRQRGSGIPAGAGHHGPRVDPRFRSDDVPFTVPPHAAEGERPVVDRPMAGGREGPRRPTPAQRDGREVLRDPRPACSATSTRNASWTWPKVDRRRVGGHAAPAVAGGRADLADRAAAGRRTQGVRHVGRPTRHGPGPARRPGVLDIVDDLVLCAQVGAASPR